MSDDDPTNAGARPTDRPAPTPGGRRPAGHDPRAGTDRAARPRQGARRAASPAARRGAGRAPCGRRARPLGDWTTRPQILVTNDDGVESRGLLALKQALDPIGDTTVVAPDTNQSAVGHQKTLMRPLRVRERTLGDGSLGCSVDGSPTDAVSLAFLGYFGHGFDLVAAGINYGANLGDDITYSGTVSAAMEAVINSCPAFAIIAGVLRASRLHARRRWRRRRSPATSSSTACRAASSINVNVPAVSHRGVRGLRGHPPRPAGLLRTSSSSGSTRAASRTTGSAARRRRGSPSRARTSTRSSTAGSRSRRSISTSPAEACSAASRRGAGASSRRPGRSARRRPSRPATIVRRPRPRTRSSARNAGPSAADHRPRDCPPFAIWPDVTDQAAPTNRPRSPLLPSCHPAALPGRRAPRCRSRKRSR